ncbi:AbrB/MazE/SpoVT family DNA-binding domain-containing protein [Paraburkholderia sediminicola]|uniref:AbrB/MazE/SpoVT family DNA-binding domain-containing protein n=1 Tax=Paraburkholderia sediminicola TaxID=458836 RepID=UPI0038BC9F79
MAESRLTTRGRTTVPGGVRKALGVKPGMRLVWHVMPDGKVLVRAKSKSLLELAGTVESPVQGVSIEDMKAWRRHRA